MLKVWTRLKIILNLKKKKKPLKTWDSIACKEQVHTINYKYCGFRLAVKTWSGEKYCIEICVRHKLSMERNLSLLFMVQRCVKSTSKLAQYPISLSSFLLLGNTNYWIHYLEKVSWDCLWDLSVWFSQLFSVWNGLHSPKMIHFQTHKIKHRWSDWDVTSYLLLSWV